MDLKSFRLQKITKPFFEWVKRALPPISQTEKEALASGTLGWEKELMGGDPDFASLFSLPPSHLSAEEKAFLEGPTQALCALVDDWHMTFVQRDIPEKVWDFLKSEGFFGLLIPKIFGGKGFSAFAASEIVIKIASRSPSLGIVTIVPNSLGPGELLGLFGTEEQKNFWLPKLASGEEIPAFALTSLEAGSDATAMVDQGVVCYDTFDGKRTLGIRLNWAKRYISLGPVCTVLGLAFKLYDPEKLLGDTEDLGITLALIPSSTPGITIGDRHYPGHQVFPNGPNEGKDVFIPMDWVIGGAAQVGRGWSMLVTALAAGRGVMLPAMAMGAMKMASFCAGSYARAREQFRLPLSSFEGVEDVIGRIASQTYLIDSGRKTTLQAVDSGGKPAILSSILKYHATEAMRRAVNDAVDVMGGKAIMDGPSNLLGSAYRALPIGVTVEGANIMTRSLMIYGQGSVRCHPFLLQEMEAAQTDDLEAFDTLLSQHLVFSGKTFLKSFWRSWTRGLFSRAFHQGPTAPYLKQIKRISATLALFNEVSLILFGGTLKRRERISGRFADALSELYLTSSVLKRFYDDGSPPEDLPLLHHACQASLYRADQALWGILKNLPGFFARSFLRVTCYPFGFICAPPLDTTTEKAAQILLSPGSGRDRLLEGIFIEEKGETGILKKAFEKLAFYEPLRRKLRHAKIQDLKTALEKGLISETEKRELEELKELVAHVCRVDVFKPEKLVRKPKKPTSRKEEIA